MNLSPLLASLAQKRQLFHSEADFQHVLAWEIHEHHPDAKVRLEYRPVVAEKMYVDIWVVLGDGAVSAIELKFARVHPPPGTHHHQVGTCKMGVVSMTIVDPELRVYGVDGLRVAEASIMPSVTSGNTNAPTIMMVGEQAAEISRRREERWRQRLEPGRAGPLSAVVGLLRLD